MPSCELVGPPELTSHLGFLSAGSAGGAPPAEETNNGGSTSAASTAAAGAAVVSPCLLPRHPAIPLLAPRLRMICTSCTFNLFAAVTT